MKSLGSIVLFLVLLAVPPAAQAYIPEPPELEQVKVFDCSVYRPDACEADANAWLKALQGQGRVAERKVVSSERRLIITIFYKMAGHYPKRTRSSAEAAK